MATNIVIVKTGIANIGSVLAGLRRTGHSARYICNLTSHHLLIILCRVIETGEDIGTATHVIIPGVGHFSQAMQQLRENNLVAPIKERVDKGLPTLFVCVGHQLLGIASEEGGFSEPGLDIIHTKVHKFPNSVRVPQQGWNRIILSPSLSTMNFIGEGFAYFSNSYAFTEFSLDGQGQNISFQGWNVAYPNYSYAFTARFLRNLKYI